MLLTSCALCCVWLCTGEATILLQLLIFCPISTGAFLPFVTAINKLAHSGPRWPPFGASSLSIFSLELTNPAGALSLSLSLGTALKHLPQCPRPVLRQPKPASSSGGPNSHTHKIARRTPTRLKVRELRPYHRNM